MNAFAAVMIPAVVSAEADGVAFCADAPAPTWASCADRRQAGPKRRAADDQLPAIKAITVGMR